MKRLATIILASVWLINGLFVKVLGLVPRHQAIVARFLGPEHAEALTRLIGLAEIAMAVWVLSGIKRRWFAITQCFIIVTMNSLEYWRARDLLLFPILMPLANLLLIMLAFWWSQAEAPRSTQAESAD